MEEGSGGDNEDAAVLVLEDDEDGTEIIRHHLISTHQNNNHKTDNPPSAARNGWSQDEDKEKQLQSLNNNNTNDELSRHTRSPSQLSVTSSRVRSYSRRQHYDPTRNYDLLFKVLLIGDSGVGKTCMMSRFADDDFTHSHSTTIGIDFKMKTISLGGKKVRIQMWDTAGQERYETITKQYYRKAQGIFLVYDVTDEKSFGRVSKWMDLIAQNATAGILVMLVGNKKDMEDTRRVSRDQGIKFAQEHSLHFCETSARTNENIPDMFQSMTQELMKYHRQAEETNNLITAITLGEDTPPPVTSSHVCSNNRCC